MIEALTQSLGIVTSACKAVGISRTLHYNWYNEDAEYKKAVDEVADIAIDFAETMLHQRIKEQDTTATIFYLKTKGKNPDFKFLNEIIPASIGFPFASCSYIYA